jgi:hypothetical protein
MGLGETADVADGACDERSCPRRSSSWSAPPSVRSPGTDRARPAERGWRAHYLGTLAVNLSGSIALGLVMGALGYRFGEEPTCASS